MFNNTTYLLYSFDESFDIITIYYNYTIRRRQLIVRCTSTQENCIGWVGWQSDNNNPKFPGQVPVTIILTIFIIFIIFDFCTLLSCTPPQYQENWVTFAHTATHKNLDSYPTHAIGNYVLSIHLLHSSQNPKSSDSTEVSMYTIFQTLGLSKIYTLL